MKTPDLKISYYQKISKPFIRWWWFANPIEKAEITRQLTWTKSMGFGGVEIAWVYSMKQAPTKIRFLSREWTEIVVHARAECLRLDLACDFTFGTLWPFGGSVVSDDMASLTYKGFSEQRWPAELDGYHPTWVSTPFLQSATVVKTSSPNNGYDEHPIIRIGQAEFSALMVDVHWLDVASLVALVKLAKQGALIFITNEPSEPGRVQHDSYARLLQEMCSCETVHIGPEVLSAQVFGRQLPPLLTSLDGNQLPLYRIRRSGNTLTCFFAHPGARGLTYPLQYGHAQTLTQMVRHIRFRIDPLTEQKASGNLRYLDLTLDFAPNQSLLIEIDASTAEPDYRYMNIT